MSEFSERADAYFCDVCKRDITKDLHSLKSRSYECVCGKCWRMGPEPLVNRFGIAAIVAILSLLVTGLALLFD